MARTLSPLALAACALTTACGSGSPDDKNVLLVVIDTLRADHVSALGYELDTTPRLERLAERSARFTQAIAHSPWTRTSMASLISGMQPSTTVQLCADRSGANCSSVPTSVTTLAEVLTERGYECRGVAANVNVEATFGYGQGFAEYVSLPPVNGSTDAVTAEALRLLDVLDDGSPFFLYAHYLDPHSPYEPTPEWQRRFRTDLYEGGKHVTRQKSKYDAEIGEVDAAIGTLLDELAARGLDASTGIVVVSDHGEEFNDHGGWNHGYTMYDELLRVPLILTLPGITDAGLTVDAQVRLIDVMPTVLDYLAIPVPAELHGSSLLPSLTGAPWDPRPALSEMGNSTITSLREPPWKLLLDDESGEARLFDLSVDPHERDDVAAEHPDVTAAMRSKLEALRARAAADGERYLGLEAPVEVSEEQLEEMRALGYIDDE